MEDAYISRSYIVLSEHITMEINVEEDTFGKQC